MAGDSTDPWTWPEETWRRKAGQAAAGRSLRPETWKDGATWAVALSFDSDGDSLPNTVAQLQGQWKSWRPYLVQELRKAVGEAGLLIGNTGGAMSLPGLNGITIEMEWCGGDTTACLDAVEGSRAVAHSPPLDVFWLTQAQMVPPDVQCRMMQQMTEQFDDGTVFAGSDVFDGSHIVCNQTSR